MKTAIIGAARTRNGIGEYIGKYAHQNGARVIAVQGTTAQTARDAAQALRRYGIAARAYSDFTTLAARETPEAVIIASPARTHYTYIIQAIERGQHIFCEKPFVWDVHSPIQEVLEDIFSQADSAGIVVAMNSQWPFSLRSYEKLCGPIEKRAAHSFFISLSPLCSGRQMIVEAVPHALSILYHIYGAGIIEGLAVESRKKKMALRFQYVADDTACNVLINLEQNKRQPRGFSFGFNENIVRREIDMETYRISFAHKNDTLIVPDPLELSVKDFLAAVREQREPLIGKQHILSTMRLLKQIYDACEVE